MTDEQARRVLDQVPTGVYVGGQWRDAAEGGRFPVTDPATEEMLLEIADAGPDDAKAALDAAAEAQPTWAATPPRERGEILRRAYEALVARSDDLALLMTLEMGKSLAESKAEVTYAAEFLRWFGEQAVRIAGRWSDEPNGSGRLLTMRQPVGPCLLITPWNFPMAMGTRKIGPAVAAGCTMVLKPAQITPLSTLALTAILEEAGLPPGVLNVVPSTSAGRTVGPVIEDPRLRKVSFTGSTEVGRSLMQQASEHVLRVSMELGGNAPLLVFDDADLDKAVEGAVVAKTRNVGQSCVAANRIYVHESVAQEFTDRFVERMSALTVGRGTDDGVDLGPLASKEQRDKVVELVTDAVDRGARVLCGGEQPDGPGFAYPPTVLGAVPDDARILREEVFGPVAPIRTFATEDDAVRQANDTEFGLVAYVFTEGLARTLRVVEALEVGMVGVNRGLVSNPAAPFGGVKQSGFGREGGFEGIEEYLSVKYTAIDT